MHHEPLGTASRPLKVLLVEDDPGDAVLTQRTLEDGPLVAECLLVTDGEQALEVLLQGGTSTPDLVLLDLNLPKVDGWGVLQALRESARLGDLRVAMLTTSSQLEDARRSKDAGAHAFLTKPISAKALSALVADLASG